MEGLKSHGYTIFAEVKLPKRTSRKNSSLGPGRDRSRRRGSSSASPAKAMETLPLPSTPSQTVGIRDPVCKGWIYLLFESCGFSLTAPGPHPLTRHQEGMKEDPLDHERSGPQHSLWRHWLFCQPFLISDWAKFSGHFYGLPQSQLEALFP